MRSVARKDWIAMAEREGCEARRKSMPSRRMRGLISNAELDEAEVGGVGGVGVPIEEVDVEVDTVFNAAFRQSRR